MYEYEFAGMSSPHAPQYIVVYLLIYTMDSYWHHCHTATAVSSIYCFVHAVSCETVPVHGTDVYKSVYRTMKGVFMYTRSYANHLSGRTPI